MLVILILTERVPDSMVQVIDRLTQVLLRTVWFKKRLALASPLSVRAPPARANLRSRCHGHYRIAVATVGKKTRKVAP